MDKLDWTIPDKKSELSANSLALRAKAKRSWLENKLAFFDL